MHAMGHVIDMRRFRGLRHRMPITNWTFAIGGLALAGIVPLAGFWSKDEILAALRLAAHEARGLGWGWAYLLIYVLAVFTAFLTAFYTGRAYFLTFWGPEKLPSPEDPEAEPDEHNPSHDPHFGHESPPVMWVPLVALAAGAVLAGIVFGPTGLFEHHLERTPGFEQLGHTAHGTDWLSIVLGTVVGVLGIALAWQMYAEPSELPSRLATRFRPLYLASYRKFFVDEFYERLIVLPTWALAKFSRFLDVYVIDGLVRFTAWVPRAIGSELLAPFQNGLLQFYSSATALGVAALLLYLLFFVK